MGYIVHITVTVSKVIRYTTNHNRNFVVITIINSTIVFVFLRIVIWNLFVCVKSHTQTMYDKNKLCLLYISLIVVEGYIVY